MTNPRDHSLYSERSASIGSTRTARIAGSGVATNAIIASRPPTARKVNAFVRK
jgi:hypothetical protein